MAKKLVEYGIEVLEIKESRWKGMGSVTLQSGGTVVHLGDDEVQQKDTIMSTKEKSAIMEWPPISRRIK